MPGGQGRPLQAQLLPPEPHEEGYGYYGYSSDPHGQGYGYGAANPGVLQGHSPPKRLRSARQSNPVFIGIAILLILGIAGALLFGLFRKKPAAPEGEGTIATADLVDGEALVTREIGKPGKLQSGFPLKEGDVISVDTGSVRVAYGDGTRLLIEPGSELTLEKHNSGKQVRLGGLGILKVEAPPQPVGQPMVGKAGGRCA